MNRSTITFALPALLGVATPAPAPAQVDVGPPLEILYGFTLIDGLGGPPIEDAAIAIRGNRILTVSTRRALLAGPDAPADAVAVNLGGGYVIPGLIDAHVHLATTPNRGASEAELRKMLYGGVTAVRDMAGDARALASLARDSRLGVIDSPDVYYSALMAGPSFLSDPRPQAAAMGEAPGEVPWMQAITPGTDLVTAVARAKGTYATGIKIYANLAPPEVRRITEEAHRQGMPAWAHSMVFPTRPLDVVKSGVDVISHVCRLAWEAMADAPTEYHHEETPRWGTFSVDAPVFTELLEEMLRRGTILDATLALYSRDERRDPESPAPGRERCDTDFARALVARAHAMGVPIAAGTDFTTGPHDPFPALHVELEELVTNGGLTPMAALEAGTRIAAATIGAGSQDGTLQDGSPVTFVLLAENPLEDIANLRTIRAVWKNAARFDRDAYRPPPAQPDETEEASERRTPGSATPHEVFEDWLALWRRYDLDRLDEVFLEDPSLTYFASDTEGVITGFEAVVDYHRGLGFVSGGFQPQRELWVEDLLTADFGESVVITGVWHFGNRVARESAGRGPMTMVLVDTGSGYKISHLNLAYYPRG